MHVPVGNHIIASQDQDCSCGAIINVTLNVDYCMTSVKMYPHVLHGIKLEIFALLRRDDDDLRCGRRRVGQGLVIVTRYLSQSQKQWLSRFLRSQKP